MDLSLIYNDPGHQMLAQRQGMNMQAYVDNMDPRALWANIENLSRGPRPNGPTMEQGYNGRLVGANSGNAFTPEAGSPITAGVLSSTPVQPQAPTMSSGALNVPSAGSPVQTGSYLDRRFYLPEQVDTLPQGRPELFVPSYPGDVPPSLKPDDAALTSGGTAATPGALTEDAAATDGTAATPGALTEDAAATDVTTSTASTASTAAPRPNSGVSSGARQTPTNNTGNARRSGMPDMRIGRMEHLGRIGAAMLGSAGDGLLASMGAGGEAMNAVNDENRNAEMAEYKNSERLRLEKAKLAALAARRGKGGKGDKTNPYGSVGAQAAQFNEIIAALKSDPNMTGLFAGSAGQFLDRSGYGDANRANLRLQMAGIALDEQLLYTAETKGAITDREMAMFREPIPRMTDTEKLWIAWLEPRAAVLNQLANNGVSDDARAAGGQATGSATDFNPADYTVVEITEK